MRKLLSAVLMSLTLVMLSGCGSKYQWNQKQTIVVQTPQGERSGYSVVRVSVTVGRQPLTDTIKHYGLTGEATVVEVAPGKYLFAVTSISEGNATIHTAEKIWANFWPKSKADEVARLREFYSAVASTREVQNVPPKLYPLLVTFSDLNDPMSVKKVDPANLAETFGAGYNLKSITLEITDEPVTEGKVEKLLGWIDNYYDTLLDGNTIHTIKAPNRLANSLASGSFRTTRR